MKGVPKTSNDSKQKEHHARCKKVILVTPARTTAESSVGYHRKDRLIIMFRILSVPFHFGHGGGIAGRGRCMLFLFLFLLFLELYLSLGQLVVGVNVSRLFGAMTNAGRIGFRLHSM